MNPHERMQRIDALLSHIWVVRTFLKHSEEAEDDKELMEIVRDLYDFSLALGPAWNAQDAAEYLKVAAKKLARLRQATARFIEVQPEISAHTNFVMAGRSLRTAVDDIGALVEQALAAPENE